MTRPQGDTNGGDGSEVTVRVHAAQRQSRSSPRLIEDKQGQEEGRGPTLCHRQIATGQLETVLDDDDVYYYIRWRLECLRLAWVQGLQL